MFMKQEIYENHVEVMIIFLLQEEQSHCHGTMSHSIIRYVGRIKEKDMIRISLSILYKKFNQTCKKRHMPNCRVRNRLNVLHKGGDFIEKTAQIEKISRVICFMFMPEIGPKW